MQHGNETNSLITRRYLTTADYSRLHCCDILATQWSCGTVLGDHVSRNIPDSYKLLKQMCCGATKHPNSQLPMSLRGLYNYLQQNSQTYMVRDGRHVFIQWRRADQVHARAKEYLRSKASSSGSSDLRAAQACQDLMDLKLLRCVQDNEPKKWVRWDLSVNQSTVQ